MALAFSVLTTAKKGWEGTSTNINDADLAIADPGADCLLLYGVGGIGTSAGADDAAWFSTGSTVAGGSLTWVQDGFSTDPGGYIPVSTCWHALVGGSAPGAFTIDLTAAPTHQFEDTNFLAAALKVTGHNTTTPIGTSVFGKNLAGNGAVTVTLPAAPAASSAVLVFVHVDEGTPNSTAVPNTGAGGTWTNLYTGSGATVQQGAYIGYRTGSTSTSVAFSDINTGGASFASSVFAVEILDGGGGGGGTPGPVVARKRKRPLVYR